MPDCFIPHFAGVGSSWRIAMKRGSVKGPQRRYAAAGPFRGRILATPPSNYCHSILLEENIERVAILNDDVVGNKGAEVALAISVAVSQNAERVT